MAERQFGPYRLIRQIAVGGMAEIHLAKTAGIAGFEKYVALKMIHPNFAEDDQFIQMLVDEAKIAVQLTHGNIAQTFDLGRVGDTYYITMEYVDGADLYKILRRASEQEREMPLDVCAFVGKEISSALDHAHRKRDHVGKSLGIVHRDVSPQNVLVSYSGEVKLVDFGIAKATMKARQTAVGVIKGKYYYMSPEQAWGDPIDHRSDIFSAGIVLYEMITGQMLYLEEDLHKLLEMARSAEIRPPSALRKGVPPQLERIVMHALAKVPGERYQTAGDFATDLERFLHAYSPVFTASKLSQLLREVVGDPLQVPNDPSSPHIELRDGAMSTHPLDDAEVAHAIDRDELRDENSVIFRISELAKAVPPPPPLKPPVRAQPPAPRPTPLPSARASQPIPRPPGGLRPGSPTEPMPPGSLPPSAPRVTRATDSLPVTSRSGKLPSIIPARQTGPTKIPQIVKPRQPHEETRQLERAPTGPMQDDGSGLLAIEPPTEPAAPPAAAGPVVVAYEVTDDDFENIAERTQVTAAPGTSFMTDFAGDDGDGYVEATVVSSPPSGPGFGEEDTTASQRDEPTSPRTTALDPGAPGVRSKSKAQPAALSAKIHAPAVSELRKPRASRRTPPSGAPVLPNVLQAIVSSAPSEPMPAPRPTPPPIPARPPAVPEPAHTPPGAYSSYQPPPEPVVHPSAYMTDASGLPLGIPTPPGVPVEPQAYAHYPAPPVQSQPLPFASMPAGYAPMPLGGQLPQGYPQLSPGALYQSQPMPNLSITGQMRLFEVDELPPQYRLNATRRRWFTYIASGTVAVAVAALATFLVIRTTRDVTPAFGSVHVESVPSNADVRYDGTLLTQKTPLTIDRVPLGGRHVIRVELAHFEAQERTIEITARGNEVPVQVQLVAITGRIVVESTPSAEIWINGELRGRSPTTIDVDRESAKVLELRLKDYQPFKKELNPQIWSSDGKLRITQKLTR